MNPIRHFARALRQVCTRSGAAPIVRARLNAEPLECRDVPSASPFRPIDGSGNNLAHPTWGQAGTAFLRVAPDQYGDGVSTPAGAERPSAREVSNTIADQHGEDVINDRLMSAMVYAWGQFVDHDLDLTASGTEELDIPVPAGDPTFDPSGTGTQVIPFTRSGFDPSTGTSAANPRQQVNSITGWLDGSMIYGPDAATAASLRTFQSGELKTTAGNLLPTDAAGFFVAGDVRVNENPELTSLQTLFMREHNRVAAQIAQANSQLTDEQIYQQARAWVIAEVQAITYNQWLPALLGGNGVGPYRGYNPNVNPGISNEFAAAGFRFGHSLVGDDIDLLGNDGRAIASPVEMGDAFFNPSVVQTNGIDPILKYLASDSSQEFDTTIVDPLRNMLITEPGQTINLDLASLNIQRGRDHGLADYNTTRAAFGLPRVTSFGQINPDPAVQDRLQQLYGSVNNIDLWVGVLAEKHLPGSSVGPTARAIIVDQFSRLRDGDRFWYEHAFSGRALNQLQHTSLTDIIQRNTTLTTVQANPFFFRAEISGTAFNDRNHDGHQGRNEPGLAGRTVTLTNADTGEVVATTTTGRHGEYRFTVADGLGTGRFLVTTSLPPGQTQTTPPLVITITSGNVAVAHADLGSAAGPGPNGECDTPRPNRLRQTTTIMSPGVMDGGFLAPNDIPGWHSGRGFHHRMDG